MKIGKSMACPLLASLMSATIGMAAEPAATADKAATPGAAASAPAAPAAPVEARIPFANHGGIYNWEVENDRSILIQSQSGKWYRARLFNSCFDLPFSERVGFVTDSSGAFDKFSSIRVRGQTCHLSSLVETTAPAKKSKKPDKPAPAPAPSTAKPG
jgi:hypothetical protein